MTARLTRLLLGATALAAFSAGTANATTRVLLNCFFPPQHFICQEVLGGWARDVTAATEGRVRVAILPQSMAPPPEQLLSARAGVFDAAIQMNGFIANEVVGTQIALLPFTSVSDARATSVALWNTYEAHLAEAGEYRGVELLGLFVAPGADFYSLTATPILSLADMVARKMWAAPGPAAEILKDAGSPVVSSPAVQMTELIQRGVVDGFVGVPASDAAAFNVLPSARSVTRTEYKIYAPAFSLFMNAATWASIDPEDQAAIRALSGEAFAERAGSIWTRIETETLGRIGDAVTVHDASPEFEAELAQAAQVWIDRWLADAAAAGIDGQAALDFYRAEIARLSE